MSRSITLLALGAVLLAGCGGGDKPSPRADLLKQADRICLNSGMRPRAIPGGLAQAAADLSGEARLRSAVRAKLAALRPPSDLRVDYARFLAASEGVAGDMRRMAGLARRGRQADFAELDRRTNLAEAARFRLAERIGFRRCGRPIQAPVRGG
jgi:hypothetical protein